MTAESHLLRGRRIRFTQKE
jgi:hypothetical protein